MLYLILLLQLYTVYIKNIKIWPMQQLFKVTHLVFSKDRPIPPPPYPLQNPTITQNMSSSCLDPLC